MQIKPIGLWDFVYILIGFGDVRLVAVYVFCIPMEVLKTRSLTFRVILLVTHFPHDSSHTKLNQTDLVNYYNISTALGRRRHDVPVDRLGAYNGSEISPFTDQYRRQCDFDSNEHCPVDAHMCHYVTPDHMRHLWFHNNNKQSTTDKT